MNRQQLRAYLKEEEARTLTGWDFSYLDGRMVSEDLPWAYRETVRKFIKSTDALLDMGTGGGEFLLTLEHPYDRIAVTERYVPNVRLCEERLSPLGVSVCCVTDDHLPFGAAAFDAVTNRHESYDEGEVFRVLKPGGHFITQQVGGRNNLSLSEKLIDGYRQKFHEHDLAHCVQKLKTAGFDVVISEQAYPPTRFFDLGAVVYLAKAIVWEYPDFSVDACFENLCKLQDELEEKGYIESSEHRFLIVAKKRNT